MKVGPNADYLVSVLREEWERERNPELYAGIFIVTLGYLVPITFLPDVSTVAPPWTDESLPADFDEASTVEQARLVTALSSMYVVTPNADRAGSADRFVVPRMDDDIPTTVRYVTPAEFDRYAVDLDHLTDVAGHIQSQVRVSEVRRYEVVQFLEEEIVPAPWLQAGHAVQLGRAG